MLRLHVEELEATKKRLDKERAEIEACGARLDEAKARLERETAAALQQRPADDDAEEPPPPIDETGIKRAKLQGQGRGGGGQSVAGGG